MLLFLQGDMMARSAGQATILAVSPPLYPDTKRKGRYSHETRGNEILKLQMSTQSCQTRRGSADKTMKV